MIFEYKGTEYEFPDDMQDDEALKLIKKDLGEDTLSTTPTTSPQPEQEKTGFLQSVGSGIKLGAEFVGKALTLPARALGTLRNNPETGKKYELQSPESNLLRPETNKLKQGIEAVPQEDIESSYEESLMSGAHPLAPPSEQKGFTKGLTEFAGTSLADPLSYLGLGGKVVSPVAKKLGVEIESSILGKGNKAIAKKERKGIEDLTKTALEENVGGSLKGTIGKIKNTFNTVEDNIQGILSTSVKENPNLKINVDDVIENLKSKINNGEYKELYGSEDAVISQLDNLKASNERYKLAGELPVDKANELKRMVGKKGFKNGMPTAETASKEMAHDLLDLALKDEIEKIVPAIKEQNAVYKKLIPIKQMAENRLPVAQGNDIISLKSAAALATNNYPLFLADLLSKSGIVAQGLYNVGKGAKKIPNLPYGELGRIYQKKEEEK